MPPSTRPLVLAMLLCGAAAIPGRSVAVDRQEGSASTNVDAFLGALAPLCGKAYAGRIEVDTPAPTAPDPFAGKPLVMHVRSCAEREWRIPFHVGEDRSRTWVLTRTDQGLRLKHDHRHADGSPDASTNYGGETAAAGTAQRQTFPVDAESIAMFKAEGRLASVSNTWALELEPGERFVYELARPGGRLFRVVFDLTQPVAAPSAEMAPE